MTQAALRPHSFWLETLSIVLVHACSILQRIERFMNMTVKDISKG